MPNKESTTLKGENIQFEKYVIELDLKIQPVVFDKVFVKCFQNYITISIFNFENDFIK